MSYQALARKWRPNIFSEVIGQEHVVSALSNALDNQRVHHAFLFTGTRGVGKTTLARIFAKALNCETGVSADPCGQCIACTGVEQGNFVDLIEVDAASRTKVDDTRELLDNVQYSPTQGRFKVYLIDEVHMLSTHSFNALLKTLEEPPDHVKFLLATTNPQKLPATILSRCIQFNLKSADIGRLSAQLEKILQAEEIKFEQSALMVLSRSANGSVRDALSLLDQAIAFSNNDVSTEHVRSMLGMIDDHYITQLFAQIIDDESSAVLETVSSMAQRSVDYGAALDELLTLIHNVSLFQVSPESVEWKGIDSAPLNDLSKAIDAETLQLFYQIVLTGKRDFEFAPDPRSGFEMVLLRMLAFQPVAHSREREAPMSRSQDQTKGTPASVSKSEMTSSLTPLTDKTQVLPQAEGNPKVTPQLDSTPSSDILADSFTSAKSAIEETMADVGESGINTPTIDVEKFMDRNGWQEFITNSGLGGISKEILMNMVPKSIEGNTVNLSLDSASRHLFNNGRLKKIESYCKENLSLDVKLNVDIDDFSNAGPENETPTQQRVREEKEQEIAAKQAFIHDPKVQQLVDQFDAEIINESIRPGSHSS